MRQLGYVGKVPHRGDFVRYNLPLHLHRVWDDWLAGVLQQAAETLDDWPAGYDSAPPWRFVLSPDLAGDQAHAGVMLASRDSVGRRFPFTLFGTLPDAATPLTALVDDGVLDALERLACDAVAGATHYEGLKRTLGELQETLSVTSIEPGAAPFRPGSSTRASEPAVYCEDAELLADRAGAIRLLDAVLRQSVGPYSAWRSRDSDTADGRLLVTGGLPLGGSAHALFGAEWSASTGGRLDGNLRTDTRRPQDLPQPPRASEPAASAVPDVDVSGSAPIATAVGASAIAEPFEALAAERSALPAATRQESGNEVERAATAPGTSTATASDDSPRTGHDTPKDALAMPDSGDDGAAAEPSFTDAHTAPAEPLEVETLSIDDEDGDAPWDAP